MSFRIPAWLVGSTTALLIAAAVRVAEFRGVAGIVELVETVALLAACAYALVVAERYEAHPLARLYVWPSRKLRKLIFLTLIAVVNFYFAVIFVRGGTLVGAISV